MRKLKYLLLPFLLTLQSAWGVEFDLLKKSLQKDNHPFNYDLCIDVISGVRNNEKVIVCCHGYGGNYSIAEVIKSHQVVPHHLVGFNFPDHDIMTKGFNLSKISFGGIEELLPLFYILKNIVVDAHAEEVSLYGFSAGGGAVINAIAVLNSHKYDQKLLHIGIDSFMKQMILDALQNGAILLDAPLKSMEEIQRNDEKDSVIAARYKMNQMRPIDALANWQGLRLTVILFFQHPDASLTNRDDALFVQSLQKANSQGKNIILIRNEGGHCGFHLSLWKAFNDRS